MLERLHAHREWANQRIIDWMLALPQTDEYCLKMFSHMLLSESMWLFRLRGQSDPVTAEMISNWQLFPLNELKSRSESNNKEWRKVLETDLSRRIRYPRLNNEESESVVSDIATHVCTHGVYHRGQIAAQAARMGLHCPPTDFIVFARMN